MSSKPCKRFAGWFLSLTLLAAIGWAEPGALAQASKPDCQPLVIVLDRSASLQTTDPAQYSASVARLLYRLWSPCPVGLVTYPGATSGLLDPSAASSQATFDNLIAHTPNGLNTPMLGGLQQTLKMLDGQAPQGAVIINITDGQPDPAEQTQAIKQLYPRFKQAGYQINTVGLAHDIDENFLREMARATSGVYYRAANPADLVEVASSFVSRYRDWSLLPLGEGTQLNQTFNIDAYTQHFLVLVAKENRLGSAASGTLGNLLKNPAATQWQQANDRHFDLWEASDMPAGDYTIQASDPNGLSGLLLLDSPLRLRSLTASQQNLCGDLTLAARLEISGGLPPLKATDLTGMALLVGTTNPPVTLVAHDDGSFTGVFPVSQLRGLAEVNLRLIATWRSANVTRTAEAPVQIVTTPCPTPTPPPSPTVTPSPTLPPPPTALPTVPPPTVPPCQTCCGTACPPPPPPSPSSFDARWLGWLSSSIWLVGWLAFIARRRRPEGWLKGESWQLNLARLKPSLASRLFRPGWLVSADLKQTPHLNSLGTATRLVGTARGGTRLEPYGGKAASWLNGYGLVTLGSLGSWVGLAGGLLIGSRLGALGLGLSCLLGLSLWAVATGRNREVKPYRVIVNNIEWNRARTLRDDSQIELHTNDKKIDFAARYLAQS